MYASSSGSLMGVLNLTMDNAPTRPRDKASEDLTTAIINVVVIDNKGNKFANDSRLEKVCAFFFVNQT